MKQTGINSCGFSFELSYCQIRSWLPSIVMHKSPSSKVYPDTSKCLTYTVCPENFKAALLLRKSFFFSLLASFFSLFLMEVRSRCTFPRVLNAKQVFSSHNTVGLLENTSIITKNSLDEHLWNWELLLWLNRGVREGKRFICTKIVTSVCGVVRLSDASINLYVVSLQL